MRPTLPPRPIEHVDARRQAHGFDLHVRRAPAWPLAAPGRVSVCAARVMPHAAARPVPKPISLCNFLFTYDSSCSLRARTALHQSPQVGDMFVFGGRAARATRAPPSAPSKTVGVRYASPDSLTACAQRTRMRIEAAASRPVARGAPPASAGARGARIFQCGARAISPASQLRVGEIAADARLQAALHPDRGSRTRA